MASMQVAGQEMDEGLEDMWSESLRAIGAIDPGESFRACRSDKYIRTSFDIQ